MDGVSATAAAAAHGYSRAASYLVSAAFERPGMTCLLDECPGRRGPVKITPEILAFAPTVDEARALTLDVLLGALSADDRRRGETVLESATDRVLTGPREDWSIPTVITALEAVPATDPAAAVAHAIGATLRVRAKTLIAVRKRPVERE